MPADQQVACDAPVRNSQPGAAAAHGHEITLSSAMAGGSLFGELLDKVYDEHQRVVGALQVELMKARLQCNLPPEAAGFAISTGHPHRNYAQKAGRQSARHSLMMAEGAMSARHSLNVMGPIALPIKSALRKSKMDKEEDPVRSISAAEAYTPRGSDSSQHGRSSNYRKQIVSARSPDMSFSRSNTFDDDFALPSPAPVGSPSPRSPTESAELGFFPGEPSSRPAPTPVRRILDRSQTVESVAEGPMEDDEPQEVESIKEERITTEPDPTTVQSRAIDVESAGISSEGSMVYAVRPSEDLVEPEPPQAMPPEFVVTETMVDSPEVGDLDDKAQAVPTAEPEANDVELAVETRAYEDQRAQEFEDSLVAKTFSTSSLDLLVPGKDGEADVLAVGEPLLTPRVSNMEESTGRDSILPMPSLNPPSVNDVPSATQSRNQSLLGFSWGSTANPRSNSNSFTGRIASLGPRDSEFVKPSLSDLSEGGEGGPAFRPRRSCEAPEETVYQGAVQRLSTQKALDLSQKIQDKVRSSLTLPRRSHHSEIQSELQVVDTCRHGSITAFTSEAFAPRRNTVCSDQLLRIGENAFMLFETWGDLAEEYRDDSDGEVDPEIVVKRRSTRDLRRLMSVQEVLASKCNCKAWITAPTTRWRLIWDLTSVLLLCYDLLTVPMLVFELTGQFFQVVSYGTSAWWSMDMMASFFVGYHTIGGTVEMRPHMVFQRYLKTWFILDFSLVLLDWIIMFMGVGRTQTGAMRVGKFTRGMRALRLLRLIKLRYTFSDLLARARSESQRTVMHILKLIMFIVAVNHFIACGFYGLSHIDSYDKTWVKENFVLDDGITYRYWTSLHWSLTQFTPASMEVVPVNSIERFYTVCALLFALITFSSFVSSITTAMTYLRTINARKMEQDTALRRYLHEHCISAAGTTRVLHYFQDREQENRRRARMKEQDCELFQCLPESLKHDLRIEAYMPILCSHPLFAFFNNTDHKVVQAICRTSVSEKRLIIRDELYSGTSSEASHMINVYEGVLSYKYPVDNLIVDDKIHKGEWCCEVALWAKNVSIYGPFIAESNCELVMICRSDFMTTITKHHKAAGQVAHYAELFVEEALELCKRCRWQTVVMGDHDSCQDVVHKAFATKSRNDGSFQDEKSLPTASSGSGGGPSWIKSVLKIDRKGVGGQSRNSRNSGTGRFSNRSSLQSKGGVLSGRSSQASSPGPDKSRDLSEDLVRSGPSLDTIPSALERSGQSVDTLGSLSRNSTSGDLARTSRRPAAKGHVSERNGSQLVRFSQCVEKVGNKDRSSIGSFTRSWANY